MVWTTHIVKVIGNIKSKVSKMDAILTDPHVKTRFEICILIPMNVIVPKVGTCSGNMGREPEFKEQLEAVQMEPAKQMLG